ncbi:MAG: hypothetical protein L3K07_09380 [Thermoplasmata archaeon]|nr:hypothetical protein [Thermoplasmata archaeon]
MSATRFGAVHGLASCVTCEWESSSYKNIQALAANHVKHNPGHRVKGEVAYAFVYE